MSGRGTRDATGLPTGRKEGAVGDDEEEKKKKVRRPVAGKTVRGAPTGAGGGTRAEAQPASGGPSTMRKGGTRPVSKSAVSRAGVGGAAAVATGSRPRGRPLAPSAPMLATAAPVAAAVVTKTSPIYDISTATATPSAPPSASGRSGGSRLPTFKAAQARAATSAGVSLPSARPARTTGAGAGVGGIAMTAPVAKMGSRITGPLAGCAKTAASVAAAATAQAQSPFIASAMNGKNDKSTPPSTGQAAGVVVGGRGAPGKTNSVPRTWVVEDVRQAEWQASQGEPPLPTPPAQPQAQPQALSYTVLSPERREWDREEIYLAVSPGPVESETARSPQPTITLPYRKKADAAAKLATAAALAADAADAAVAAEQAYADAVVEQDALYPALSGDDDGDGDAQVPQSQTMEPRLLQPSARDVRPPQPETQNKRPSRRPSKAKKKISRLSDLVLRSQGLGDTSDVPVVVAIKNTDEKAVVQFLVSGAVYGFPHTNGGFWSNFAMLTANEHPLLSIVLAHRLHPFSHRRRVIVFMCTAAFAFFVTVCLMSEYYFPRWRKCDEGCHALYPAHEVSTNDDTDMTAFCGPGSGRNQDSTVADYNDECGYYAPYMVGIMAACIIVPYGAFLRFAAMCPCIQGIDSEGCFGPLKRSCNRLGGSLLSYATTLSMFFLGYGLWLAHEETGDATTVFTTFIYTECFQVLDWFVLAMLYYAAMFSYDRERFLIANNDEKVDQAERLARDADARREAYMNTIQEGDGDENV